MTTTTATVTPLLSDAQHAQFLEEGYFVVENAILPTDLQPVIDEISGEIDTHAATLVSKGELSRSYDEYGFDTRLAHISKETDQLALKLWNGDLCGPGIFSLISHPRLLDIAEQLCGPEIIGSSVYRLRPKIPNYGYGAVPWHQDSSYFEPYCDNALVVTMWVPLVDTNEDNGCLWVVPGSHKNDVLTHQLHSSAKYLEITEETIDDVLPQSARVCCPVPKGGVLLLTNKTIHGSFLNKTENIRWSLDLRYQSAALPTNAHISRLEHEDVESVELAVPAACYPPEADFLARSRARPDEVIRTQAAFEQLRNTHASTPVTNRWGVTWSAPKKIETTNAL